MNPHDHLAARATPSHPASSAGGMMDALRVLRGDPPRHAAPNRQARRAADADQRRRARKAQRAARKRHR